MGILADLDKTYNPLRKVGDAMDNAVATANADPTGQKAAVAAGQVARQEAIDRGKGIEVRQTPTGAVEKKPFPEN
jgi:hypothetical protein